MAHFYASIQGSRGEATRLGYASSGMKGRIQGWHSGISVKAVVIDGKDTFHVYLTSGSNGTKQSQLLGTYTVDNLA